MKTIECNNPKCICHYIAGKEKIIAIKNHTVVKNVKKVGRLAKEIELLNQNAMTTTEISYKISLARKKILKYYDGSKNSMLRFGMKLAIIEIRQQLQLRSRGRK